MSAKAWERLADEALADALEWKTRARDAEASRAELLDALRWVVTCCDPNGDDGLDVKAMEHAIDRAREAIARSQVTT